MIPEIKMRIDQIRRGEVPEGYRKGKLGIVPYEWDEVPFSTLFTSTSNYTDNLDTYPLYSLTIEDGITPKTERYERSHLVKKDNSYKIVRPNDYAYNPMNIRFGAVARHKGNKPVAVSGYYDIFTTVHQSDLAFMDSFLTCGAMIAYYNKVSTGSLVEKQRVHFSDFLSFSLPLPSLKERKMIAEIIKLQDQMIELNGQMIRQLELMKKACLRKMFPEHGNNVPEVRFPRFTDPWEQRKLEYVVDFLDTMRKPLEGAKRVSGPYPYYGASGIVDYVDGYLFDEELVLLSEDGANITDRNYPVCFLASGKYWVNNHAHVLKVKDGNENNFICNSLERKDYKQYNSGMAIPKLNQEVCRSIPISCPQYDEQEKIGDYFRSLDNLITLYQRKLDKEKQKKKALMQLLFSGIVRVTV